MNARRDSVVGVASVTIDEPGAVHVITLTVPLFNLVPSEGEPARFGFEAMGLVPVIIDTSVDQGDDYDVVASVKNATTVAGLLSSQVTIWGVPGDPRHNSSHGWECIAGGEHYEKSEVSTPCPLSASLARDAAADVADLLRRGIRPANRSLAGAGGIVAGVRAGRGRGADPANRIRLDGDRLRSLRAAGLRGSAVYPVDRGGPRNARGEHANGGQRGCEAAAGPDLEAQSRTAGAVRPTSGHDGHAPRRHANKPLSGQWPSGLPEGGEDATGGVGFVGFKDFQEGSPTATVTEGFDFTTPSEPKSAKTSAPKPPSWGRSASRPRCSRRNWKEPSTSQNRPQTGKQARTRSTPSSPFTSSRRTSRRVCS